MRNVQSQNTNFEINVNTLAAAAFEKQGLYRLEDQQIQSNRYVLKVIEVVSCFLEIIFERGAIAVIDLRPSCGARFDHPALLVKGNLPGIFFFLVRHKRTRANKIHVAEKDVAKLRQFIEAGPSQPSAQSGA